MTNSIRLLIISIIIVLALASCGIFSSPAVELTIQATSAGPYNAVDQVINFSYSIKNIGNAALPSTVIVTSDKSAVTCPNVNTPGNPDDSLDRDETIVCTGDYRITQADLDAGSVTNNATADVNGTISNQATFTVSPVGTRSLLTTSPLALKTTASPLTYDQVGQKITLTYVIKNTGTSNLGPAQFTVSDSLIGATPFNCGDPNVTLTPNSEFTCAATYTITQTDLTAVSVTNIATASGGGVGPSPAASTTINKVTSVLALSTTANPITYNQAGQKITYTYVIKNNGAVNLGPAQFTVNDNLISATPINCGDPNANLAPSLTVTCTATYTITQADLSAVSIINIATASGGGVGPSASASSTITRSGSSSNLSAGATIQHTVIEGEWLWQIARCYGADPVKVVEANPQLSNPAMIKGGAIVTVPNIGSVGKIYAPLPCIGTHTVQSGDTWSSIAAKYNADATVLQMVNASTLAVGSVIKVPLNSAGGTATVPNALILAITANPLIYEQVGQVITYTYTIKNNGNTTLGPAQFTVSDSLISATPINCGSATTSLPPSLTVTCTATYTITQNDLTAVSVTNIATASGGGAGPSLSATTTINKGVKALALTTTANPINYNQVGQVITFTYVIKNSGNTTLGPAQFTVSDSLISATPINCGNATTSLPPSLTVTCTATYTITQNDLTAVSVTNIATASGGGAGPSQSASSTVIKQ